MKVLILGVNGFIGSHLSRRILKDTDWEIYGMDLGHDKLGSSRGFDRFHFVEGDIAINKEWIEYHIKKCDVVLPLVAIATPKTYIENPLGVFELDFEENLRIIRQCVKYRKRVIFPSTSEVYGMCPDAAFDEYSSHLVLGPIYKERWIYSCSKQLLDRVIWAYGKQGARLHPFPALQLDRTAPRLARNRKGRVVPGRDPVHLGPGQRRAHRACGRRRPRAGPSPTSMTASVRHEDHREQGRQGDGQIFNIGNPANNCSIKDLADKLIGLFKNHPSYRPERFNPRVEIKKSQTFYGDNYQDINTRVPSIEMPENSWTGSPKWLWMTH